ncbi:metallophosphoesterase family protein [Shimia marina]|uniref:Calcineurin-like phosphoesterase superfamily domain protein n=1 Tax=Shimia marina TaxID=321267 RepID=A0A0N7LSA4_9RHOB|nr:metallophosphoesterase family protein [Shimia marina]CUH53068.1 Calcineurin-like phosphoesterase superfamily domain protein [Shimia marina]SFE44148.1 Calcineurin-like phosphoesterase superfamily domain-containing protein [Shimia marina]
MRFQDLGELPGTVLLFGGPYSNLQATEALLAQANGLGLARDHLICTGDIVAYCAQPAQTVALLRDSGVSVVAGNCEIQLGAHALDCGCGFDEGTACDLLSVKWYAHANARVDDEARRWMAQLPQILVFTQAGKRVAVIHGGVTDVARFIWKTSPEVVFEEEIAALRAVVGAVDVVVAGHSGICFSRQIGGVQWVNAGVIGMPPHDGKQATRYALMTEGTVSFCDLTYDVAAAVSDMQQAGLTQGYHLGLRDGYWPSEDVLPEELRVPLADRRSPAQEGFPEVLASG